MSVANVFLGSDKVSILADTCSYLGRAPAAFHRKLTGRPAARLALTTRGNVWVGDTFANLSADWRDYEEAARLAVPSAEGIVSGAAHTGADLGPGFELTLIGWCGGPRAMRLTYSAVTDVIDVADLAPGGHVEPSIGRHDVPPDLSDEQLVAIAVLQQRVSMKIDEKMCVGGDVELVTVDRAGVVIRGLGAYPNKQAMLSRINARGDAMLDPVRLAA